MMKALALKKPKVQPPLFKLGDYDIVNVAVLSTGQTFENWTGNSPIEVQEVMIGHQPAIAVRQEATVSVFIATPLVIECRVPDETGKPKKPEEDDDYIVPEE
jgi:hypothetical protein